MLRYGLLAPMFCLLFITPCVSAGPQQSTGRSDSGVHTHLQRGADYLKANQIEQAIHEFKAAVGLDPQSAAGHMLLGQAYLAQRSLSMIAEAKAEFLQALDLDPGLIWARFYLAKVNIDLGRLDKAKDELERGLEMRPNLPHFLSLLGEVNRKLGNPEIAIQLNRQALKTDASMTPAYYYIGLAYMDLKKQDEAIQALEESVKSPYVAPEMYFTLGSLYAGKKRYQEGEELVKKGIALDPSRPEGHVNLAQLCNIKGASDRALQELKLALPEGKNYPTTAYYQQVQADAFFEMGRAYKAKRMIPQAIQAYSTALDFNPNKGETHSQLAELCLWAGEYTRAMQHVSMAEKLGFHVEEPLRSEIVQRKAGVP